MKGVENLPALAHTRRLLRGLRVVKDLLHVLMAPGICHWEPRLSRYAILAPVVFAWTQGTVFLSHKEYECPRW